MMINVDADGQFTDSCISATKSNPPLKINELKTNPRPVLVIDFAISICATLSDTKKKYRKQTVTVLPTTVYQLTKATTAVLLSHHKLTAANGNKGI